MVGDDRADGSAQRRPDGVPDAPADRRAETRVAHTRPYDRLGEEVVHAIRGDLRGCLSENFAREQRERERGGRGQRSRRRIASEMPQKQDELAHLSSLRAVTGSALVR